MSRRLFTVEQSHRKKKNSEKIGFAKVSLLLKMATTKKRENKRSCVKLSPEKGKNKNIFKFSVSQRNDQVPVPIKHHKSLNSFFFWP